MARRLAESGVRFIQVWHGEGQPWDSHDDIHIRHARLARECDQAIGALLRINGVDENLAKTMYKLGFRTLDEVSEASEQEQRG